MAKFVTELVEIVHFFSIVTLRKMQTLPANKYSQTND